MHSIIAVEPELQLDLDPKQPIAKRIMDWRRADGPIEWTIFGTRYMLHTWTREHGFGGVLHTEWISRAELERRTRIPWPILRRMGARTVVRTLLRRARWHLRELAS